MELMRGEMLGRSPHGERGLKSSGLFIPDNAKESLSSRRAWIEMLIQSITSWSRKVALLTESVD